MNNESIVERLKRFVSEKKEESKAPVDRSELSLNQRIDEPSSLESYRPVALASLRSGAKRDDAMGLTFQVQSWRARMSAEKIKQETALSMLQDHADAAKRESFALWTARSAQIAEKLMTYLKEHLDNMETVRMENAIGSLTKAAEMIDAKLKYVDQQDLIEPVKDKLMKQIYEQYEVTCAKIKNESLMDKYKSKS